MSARTAADRDHKCEDPVNKGRDPPTRATRRVGPGCGRNGTPSEEGWCGALAEGLAVRLTARAGARGGRRPAADAGPTAPGAVVVTRRTGGVSPVLRMDEHGDGFVGR